MTWKPNRHSRSVPERLQRACFRRDDNTCQRCGYIGTPGTGDINADHITNRAEGGTDTLGNLQTLCIPCHAVKTAVERARGQAKRSGRRRPRTHPADALR